MSIDKKNLENNILDEDALEQVSGGKKRVNNLRYDKKAQDSKKLGTTLYKGQQTETANLLYKDDDRITSILDEESRLC